MIKKTKTGRGFALIEFKDDAKVTCSLQKSSSASADKIWLGCNEIGLKAFTPFGEPQSWKEYSEKEVIQLCGDKVTAVIANTRMHLSRERVKELLPYLQNFVDTGELY